MPLTPCVKQDARLPVCSQQRTDCKVSNRLQWVLYRLAATPGNTNVQGQLPRLKSEADCTKYTRSAKPPERLAVQRQQYVSRAGASAYNFRIHLKMFDPIAHGRLPIGPSDSMSSAPTFI